MLFDLTLINYETKDTKIWQYDTSNNTIKDEHKNVVSYTEELPIRKKEKKLVVQLGYSCNMSCSYCLQSKTKKNKFNKEQCDKIIDDLSNMNLSDSRLEFWGGEPLLYFKEIVYILKSLKRRFRERKNELPSGYLIITNGMLLTVRIVKFLMKNNFSIAVSHDAQGQDVRGKEPLENESSLEAIKYLYDSHRDNFSFNSVITKNNINTENRMRYFAKYLEIEDYQSIPHGGEGPVYNSNLDLIDTNAMGDEIYLDILNGSGMFYNYYTINMEGFFRGLGKRELKNITTKCGIDKEEHYKALSMDGKELTCHNYDFKFELQTLQSSNKCLNCPVVQLCKSSCPAIDKESEMFKKNCEVMFATNMALLRVIVFILSGYKYQLSNVKESISSNL